MTLARLTLQRAHEDSEKTLGAIYDEKGRRECVTLEHCLFAFQEL